MLAAEPVYQTRQCRRISLQSGKNQRLGQAKSRSQPHPRNHATTLTACGSADARPDTPRQMGLTARALSTWPHTLKKVRCAGCVDFPDRQMERQ